MTDGCAKWPRYSMTDLATLHDSATIPDLPESCQFCGARRLGFQMNRVIFTCGTTVPKNGGRPKCSAGCFLAYNERLRIAAELPTIRCA